MSPFGILAGLAFVVGVAAASTLTVSPSGFYSGLTVRIEDGAVDPDGDCSDVLDNLEVGQTERWGWLDKSELLAVADSESEGIFLHVTSAQDCFMKGHK